MAAYQKEIVEDEESQQVQPVGQSRRALLTALALGGAFAAAKSAEAQTGNVKNVTQLRNRLLRRITYGASEADVKLARKLGYDAYIDYQLNYEAIDDSACENAVKWYSTIFFSERDLYKVQEHFAKTDLVEATMVRAILSKRQLYQRMVEFWTDHFNVYYDKVGFLKVVHDRDVIRKYALGNFEQMLMANTKSPATIVYLDNEPSTKESPNQNLARELMELHAIGVDGGYTQADVISVAKCLTGWTVRTWPDYSPDIGKFVFDKNTHANNTKIVFGQTIAPGGWIKDGEAVVNMLVKKRAAGRYLAKKLWRFFIGSEPTPDQYEPIADIYLATNGEIKPMVKAVLAPANMTAAPLVVKRPFHYTMGLLRTTQAAVANTGVLRDLMYEMGQHPFEWAPPNGYPFAQGYWAPQLLPRWNFALELFGQSLEKITVDKKLLLQGAVTLTEVLDRLDALFFLGELGTDGRALLAGQLISDEKAYGRSLTVAGMATAMPGYQLC